MIAVLDANVVLALLVDLPYSHAVREPVSRVTRAVAPDLLFPEIANGLWRIVTAGQLQAADATGCMARAASYVAEVVPSQHLASPSLALAIAKKHAAYDLFYVALAHERGATLITADKKLAALAASLPIPVICPI